MKNITKYISYLLALLFTQGALGFSNIEVGEGSATVFKHAGMSDNDNALIITAGHTLNYKTSMSKTFKYKNKKKEFYNYKALLQIMFYKSHKSIGAGGYATKILYATMEGTDIAVIELNKTYKELSELGIVPLELAESPAKIGDKLSFNSYFLQTDNSCVIEDITSIKEDIYTFNSAYKLKLTPECNIIPGNSGTAGVIDGKIYQVAFTRNEKQKDREGNSKRCKRNNPCESEETAKGQAYSTDVTFLNKCYNTKKKKFEFSKECIHGK